jgi:hypothetical protein
VMAERIELLVMISYLISYFISFHMFIWYHMYIIVEIINHAERGRWCAGARVGLPGPLPALDRIVSSSLVYSTIHSMMYYTAGQWSSGKLHCLTGCGEKSRWASCFQSRVRIPAAIKTFCSFCVPRNRSFFWDFYHIFTWNEITDLFGWQ